MSFFSVTIPIYGSLFQSAPALMWPLRRQRKIGPIEIAEGAAADGKNRTCYRSQCGQCGSIANEEQR